MSLVLKRQLFYKFEIDLFEGVVYHMFNLTTTANLGEYRATQHAWKLNFKRDSRIRRGDINLVQPYCHTFTSPSTIWLPSFDANYLVGGYC